MAAAVRCMLAALLILPGTSLVAQTAASPADTVKLTFAWPANVTMPVVATKYRENLSDGTGDTTRSGLRYRFGLCEHPEGFEVLTSDLEVDGLDASDSSTAAQVARLTALIPSYIVNPEGDFKGLSDPARLRMGIDSLMAPVRAELRAASPGADSLLMEMLSAEMLASSVAQEWNALVGFWVGAELEVGSAYEFEQVERIPLFGGMDLPMRYEFGVVERTSCDSSAAEERCVDLVMVSEPDDSVAARLIAAVMSKLLPPGAVIADTGRRLTIRNTVHLVADPATLRPYHLLMTREIDLALLVDGTPSTGHRLDVRESWYAEEK